MKLTRKTFTTKDTKGCEFKVTAYYNGEYYDEGEWVKDTDYYGMGMVSKSLQWLKESVAAIKR